jgi:type IV secretion system protein VirB5
MRPLSTDPVAVRQNWLEAYGYTTDRGAWMLNDYARAHDPFAHVGQDSVLVDAASVVRVSDT